MKWPHVGLELFTEVFDALDAGHRPMVPQDHTLATWEPAIVGVPALHRPDLDMLPAPCAALSMPLQAPDFSQMRVKSPFPGWFFSDAPFWAHPAQTLDFREPSGCFGEFRAFSDPLSLLSAGRMGIS
jgi:hypothetical protein